MRKIKISLFIVFVVMFVFLIGNLSADSPNATIVVRRPYEFGTSLYCASSGERDLINFSGEIHLIWQYFTGPNGTSNSWGNLVIHATGTSEITGDVWTYQYQSTEGGHWNSDSDTATVSKYQELTMFIGPNGEKYLTSSIHHWTWDPIGDLVVRVDNNVRLDC